MAEEFYMPFGKYKGRPLIDVLRVDAVYIAWLKTQSFLSDYPALVEALAGNDPLPREPLEKNESSPAHNLLQAKFTDPDYVRKFLKLINSQVGGKFIEYEHSCGADVVISGEIFIEIKP